MKYPVHLDRVMYSRGMSRMACACCSTTRNGTPRIAPSTLLSTKVLSSTSSILLQWKKNPTRILAHHVASSLTKNPKRFLSSMPSSRAMIVPLRNMIKPFLLKCHPDVHVSESAKTINLAAIQNLNSFLDTVQLIESADKQVLRMKLDQDPTVIEIDFVLQLEGERHTKKKDKASNASSRRKVEIVLPPARLCQEWWTESTAIGVRTASTTQRKSYLRNRLYAHCHNELYKLLRVAGLSITPASNNSNNDDDHGASTEYMSAENRDWEHVLNELNQDPDMQFSDDYQQSPGTRPHQPRQSDPGTFRRSHHHSFHQGKEFVVPPPKTPYERNRERFTSQIQWHNYDKLYARAVAIMNADAATEGLIERHAGRRRAMIAGILANVRLFQPTNHDDGDSPQTDDEHPSISFVEQLVAFRRLSLILDLNFAKLQMEEFGAMWETCNIVLTPARPYNVSSSSLHRRGKKTDNDDHMNFGYSFTLHPDFTVTIHIPVDFRDDELIRELDRNVWDFYNLLDDGMDELFPYPSALDSRVLL